MNENNTITDYNYEEVLDKRYETVPNNTFIPTKKVEKVVNTDFMETSNNFWLTHEGGKFFPVYTEGIMGGTFNARQPNFKAVTDTFMEALKNILRIQAEKEDKTPEEFNVYIQMLETAFTLISDKLTSTMDERIDGELIMAYLHATFNSFINTNIKLKE